MTPNAAVFELSLIEGIATLNFSVSGKFYGFLAALFFVLYVAFKTL